MARKLKKKLPKAQPGRELIKRITKNLLNKKYSPSTINRFLSIKNNPINQRVKSNFIFDNTKAVDQDAIDYLKTLVNSSDEKSQIEFMNIVGNLQKNNPKASFHINTGEKGLYIPKTKLGFDRNARPGDPNAYKMVQNVTDDEGTVFEYTPELAAYMRQMFPDVVDVNRVGRVPLNMFTNKSGTPYYTELSENLRQYGDFGVTIQGLPSTDPKALLNFNISRAPFGEIKNKYSGEMGNQGMFLKDNKSPFIIESPTIEGGIRTNVGNSGLKLDSSLMDIDPNFKGTFMKFLNKKEIPESRFLDAKNMKEYNLLSKQQFGPMFKLDYSLSDLFTKPPEFYPIRKQPGGTVSNILKGFRNRLNKIAPSIFPTLTPPSMLGPMKTIKVGKGPSLSFDDWKSYVGTGNVKPLFEPFYSQKARQHIVPSFASVNEFGTLGLTGDLIRKEPNRFNNLVFDRGLMISPAQGTGRKSVHFTGTGEPVPGHFAGNWDHVTNTFALPMADAIRYNAMPRSTALNDVYFYNPRQFVYPPSTKILTGDMELASNARGIGLDVSFNKELFRLNKQINKLEELKNTPGTKYSYNESTSSGNFNSDKYNLYKQEKDLLSAQVKKLTDDWLIGLNLQGIDHLNPAYKLGFRDFDPNLRNDQLRNIRSSSQTPYVHSESPEFNYYMEGVKDASGNTVKSRSQRINENPSLLDDITMDQAKDPAYNLFENARIYKGGYDKKGMVEPSQADLILYQKQIFSYPKEYVEKILANYDAKGFPKDGPYRKILENYIKDGSAGVKYKGGGFIKNISKEYGGQTPGLALDDTPDRTYKNGGATRISLSEYQNGGEPNYNQMLIDFIKSQEAGMEFMKAKNSSVMKPDGSGYYKRYENGTFYPYYHQNTDGSFEKEATIGYGTKGKDIFEMYKDGMSMPEANELLHDSLNEAHRKTKIYVDANYGEGFYDNLSDQKKAMLADYTFNLGKLSLFPNFAEGILTDNTELALAEYIRGEEKGGAKLGRNKAYLETFLQPWVNQTIEKKEKEKQERIQKERDAIMEEKYSSWYSPFIPNSIENLFKQNYDWEDQYFKDKGITTYKDGGEYSDEVLRLFQQYQDMIQSSFSEDLRNDAAQLYVDMLKREGVDIENMSQGEMFNLARTASEAGYVMPFQEYDTKGGKTNVPQFIYKGKAIGIEEYDDPVLNMFRSEGEVDDLLRLAQSIPSSYFTNKDIKTEEDYEKAIFDYFSEEGTVPNQLVSRYLRDVKSAGNIGELSYMENVPMYNLMRDIINPKYDKNIQGVLNQQKLIDFFESPQFNRGTKQFKEWEKNYNAKATNLFNNMYLDNMVGMVGTKERLAFDEYMKNNPEGGDNEFYEAIKTGMQKSADLYNITNIPTTYNTPAGLLGTGESNIDYSTFAEGDVPYWMKDARMAYLDERDKSGAWKDKTFNYYENRPKTKFEDSWVTRNWDKLGHYLKYDAFHLGPSGGKNMFNVAFGDLLYGVVDWAAKTAGGVLGVDGDKYEAYERFKENPTPGTFGMLGLDVVSFVPVGRGAKLLTGLTNTGKSAQFLTKGLKNTPGWQNKSNLLFNNLDDLTNLRSLSKKPPTGPFSSISTGTTFTPKFNLGTLNKPKYTPFTKSGYFKTPYQLGLAGVTGGTGLLEGLNPSFFDSNDPNYLRTGLMNYVFPNSYDPLIDTSETEEKNN